MNKLVLPTVAVAFSAVSFGTTTVASVQNTPVYYLSLGDSLSVGIQPNQSDLHRPFPFIGAGGFGGALSREGFSDQLAALKRQTISNLHLVKLGCNGESTSSMIALDVLCKGEIVWSEYIGDGGALVLVMTGPLDNWKCGRGYPGRRVKLMSCRSPAPRGLSDWGMDCWNSPVPPSLR